MSRRHLHSSLLCLFLLGLSGPSAWAGVINLSYDENAPAPTHFRPSSTVNVNFFPVNSVEFFVDVTLASRGDFAATHSSNVTVVGPSTPLSSPGTAAISISQFGISSSFRENTPGASFSAGANVNTTFGTIPITPVDESLIIQTSGSGNGALGATLTGADTASVARVGVGVAIPFIDVATVGAAPSLTGSSSVLFGSSILGTLSYQHQAIGSLMGSIDVSIAGLSTVLVDLPEVGLYDFQLANFRLPGRLTSTKTPGVKFDLTLLNNEVASANLGISAASQTSTKNFQLASAQGFAFTVQVDQPVVDPPPGGAVPEPSTILIWSVLGIAVVGARRSRPSRSDASAV